MAADFGEAQCGLLHTVVCEGSLWIAATNMCAHSSSDCSQHVTTGMLPQWHLSLHADPNNVVAQRLVAVTYFCGRVEDTAKSTLRVQSYWQHGVVKIRPDMCPSILLPTTLRICQDLLSNINTYMQAMDSLGGSDATVIASCDVAVQALQMPLEAVERNAAAGEVSVVTAPADCEPSAQDGVFQVCCMAAFFPRAQNCHIHFFGCVYVKCVYVKCMRDIS